MPYQYKTRPSVNHAKDWLDQLFLFPSLEKGFTYGCVFGHFRRGGEKPNKQPGDPRASLLLTSEKAESTASSS